MYQSLERTGMIDLQRLHDDIVERSVFWAKTGEGSITMERYVQGWFSYILPEHVEESKIPWMIGMRQKFADKLKSCCAEQLTESEYNKLVARMDEIVKDYPPITIVRARFH